MKGKSRMEMRIIQKCGWWRDFLKKWGRAVAHGELSSTFRLWDGGRVGDVVQGDGGTGGS